MDTIEALAAQTRAIEELVRCVPKKYSCAFLNFEFKTTEEDGDVSDWVGHVVEKRVFRKPSSSQFDLGIDAILAFNTLATHFSRAATQNFITLDVLLYPRTFKIHLDYDPPTRLHGDLLAAPRYLKYVSQEPQLKVIGQRT